MYQGSVTRRFVFFQLAGVQDSPNARMTFSRAQTFMQLWFTLLKSAFYYFH